LCARRTIVCLVCAAIDSVVLTVDAQPAVRLEHAAEKLAWNTRVGVAFHYQHDFLVIVVGVRLFTPLSSIAGFAGGFGGIVPYGVVGKTLAGGTGVWLAAGPLQLRGGKLVRVDRASVAHTGAAFACRADVGEDAGLGKVVCGTRRTPVGVLHLGRYWCEVHTFKGCHLLHGCWNSALDMGWAKERAKEGEGGVGLCHGSLICV
jgi:hypothetical protein